MNLISKWLEDYWSVPLTAIRLRILMSILFPVCLFLCGLQIALVLGIMSLSWLATLGAFTGYVYPAIPVSLSLIFLGVPLVKLWGLISKRSPKILLSEAKFYFWILAGFFIALHLAEIGLIVAINT
ncbi:MAG: hypothetical protein ACKOWE_02265 [Micrococcales bacterium]